METPLTVNLPRALRCRSRGSGIEPSLHFMTGSTCAALPPKPVASNSFSVARLIERLFQMRDRLRNEIPVVYLEYYDLEASGTSGMKAALDGVPSLSVLDGWWIEGCVEGVTGWAIGEHCEKTNGNPSDRVACDAASLYDKLENVVVPLFYRQPDRFVEVMRHAIALNGSFFNTQRMVLQYVQKAYFR